MSRSDRKREELSTYQELIKNNSVSDQYLMDKSFFTEWFDFIQSPIGSEEDIPEIIDNEPLLAALRNKSRLDLSTDYHKVNDVLFEFFHNLYGCNHVIRQLSPSEMQQKKNNNKAHPSLDTSQPLNGSHATKSAIKDFKHLTEGIVGLQNNRYYCYMNAIMQAFTPMQDLRNFYLAQDYA